jgi:hypothetical protein
MARICTRWLRPTSGAFRATHLMFPRPPSANHIPHGADSRVLRVSVTDVAHASDLVAFLGGTAYEAVQIAPDALAVRPPAALAEEIARMELEIYLRVWRRTHPGVGVEVAPPSG